MKSVKINPDIFLRAAAIISGDQFTEDVGKEEWYCCEAIGVVACGYIWYKDTYKSMSLHKRFFASIFNPNGKRLGAWWPDCYETDSPRIIALLLAYYIAKDGNWEPKTTKRS